MKLSIVINCDNRNENNHFGGSNLMGVTNEDMIVEGLKNKIKFFDGFEKEIIVHLDKHNEVPYSVLRFLEENTDTLLIRKHTHEHLFNDWNYLRALSMASGEVIIHIDQDTAMFARSKEDVEYLLGMLAYNEYVSYPSNCSPSPVHDDSFDHTWVSTRFFMTSRPFLILSEVAKCLSDYDYWCVTYPVNRKCHWLEHLYGSIAKHKNQKVFYPPIELDKYAIFSWGSYQIGTLKMLNSMSYEEVKQWIEVRGIHYPVDLHV